MEHNGGPDSIKISEKKLRDKNKQVSGMSLPSSLNNEMKEH